MAQFVSRFRNWLDDLEKEAGWVAIQLGDPSYEAVNRTFMGPLVQACEAEGTITAGIWYTRPFTAQQARAAIIESGAHLFIAEAEIPAQMIVNGQAVPNPQAQDWTDLAFHLHDLKIDKAVATSWAPFQKYENGVPMPAPEFAKPLTDDDWYVLPYVYPAENPNDTVARATFYATHYPAWSGKAEPVCGTYQGFKLSNPAFDGRDDCPGWSVWDAGEQF